jgi:hypothetical protein
MDMIKAKFKCNSVTNYGHNKSAQLSAVYGKEGENADFAKATPSGQITIAIDNDTPASDFIEPNQDYYVYFEKVPKAES